MCFLQPSCEVHGFICVIDLYFTNEETEAQSLVFSHIASKGRAGDLVSLTSLSCPTTLPVIKLSAAAPSTAIFQFLSSPPSFRYL